MEWYYADEKENQIGAVSEDQIKALAISGKVTGKTMVWQDGMSEWAPAEATPLKIALSPTTPVATKPPARSIPPKIGSADSFDRDDSLVYPQNPPRSAHLNWLNLLGPGLAQIIYGKVWMGVCAVALNTILTFVYNIRIWNEESTTFISVLVFAVLIVSIVDGIMTAKVLQSGRPVGKWKFFPR